MPGGVRQQDGIAAVFQGDEIVTVATGFIGRAVPAGQLIPGNDGIALGEGGLLNLAGQLQVPRHPLLLGELLQQRLTMQRHARLRAEHARQLFVLGGEATAALVQCLENPHQLTAQVLQRKRQHVARAKTRLAVYVRVEPRVCVRVRNVDHLTAGRRRASQAPIGGKPDRLDPGRHTAVQLMPVAVVQEDGGTLAIQNRPRGFDDRLEQTREVERRRHLPRHVQQATQVLNLPLGSVAHASLAYVARPANATRPAHRGRRSRGRSGANSRISVFSP
jgi:hypothetical protein